jgi:DNA repair exonuclease SbcCD ATPase subunit
MIKTLMFDLKFSSTGKEIHADHVFNKGMSLITGPNEQGKSTRLEMIRYALFGTKALRGSVKDYETLIVNMSVDILGDSYGILRSKTSCKLQKNKKDLASGTTAVNQKIIELLGYGLDVFDVANNCNQGKVDALGDMKPTERKKMVDQTIGLNTLDIVIKQMRELSSENSKAAETTKAVLVEPIEPTQPEDYKQSDILANLRTEATVRYDRRNELEGWLTHNQKGKPSQPCKDIDGSVAELEVYQAGRQKLLSKRQKLQGLLQGLSVEPEYTTSDLDAGELQIAEYEIYQDALARASRNPAPTHNKGQLSGVRTQNEDFKKWTDWLYYKETAENLQKKGSNTCPKCDHTWALEQAEIDRLIQRQKDLGPVQETSRPKLSMREYENLLDQINRYVPTEVPAKVKKPELSAMDIAKGRLALDQAKEAVEVNNQLDALDLVGPDRSGDLKILIQYWHDHAVYEKELRAYEAYVVKVADVNYELLELNGFNDDLDNLHRRFTEAKVYEQAFASYNDAYQTYEQNLKVVEDYWHKADQYSKVVKGLKALKVKVKTYLVPSLNRVASDLLSQMTNGARQIIKVDEEFNIMVDGQPINTLSGSAKAVANLALRIALGQVLTNKVLSVFMGDEIDASMDQDRSDYTAQCIRNLTSTIDQILIVSHKQIETDHIIEV